MLPLLTSSKIFKLSNKKYYENTLQTKNGNDSESNKVTDEGSRNSNINKNLPYHNIFEGERCKNLNNDTYCQETDQARLIEPINCENATTSSRLVTPISVSKNNEEMRENSQLTRSVPLSEEIVNSRICEPTSFSSKISEKISAVAGKISAKLNFQARNTTSSRKSLNVEKTTLISTFIDNGNSCNLIHAQTYDFKKSNFLNKVQEKQCRICLMHGSLDLIKKKQRLIAPCRCSGTVKFVHISCLTHWIEVSSRKMYYLPTCELCGYKFRRKSFINLKRIHFPYVKWCDRILNMLFIFLVGIMILCAWVSVHYLRLSDRRPLIRTSRKTSTRRFLTDNDVSVIIASILFFAAFFIALFTQYRAEVTIFRILSRMWATNRNWQIQDYDPKLDDNDPESCNYIPSVEFVENVEVITDSEITRLCNENETNNNAIVSTVN